jgi:deazaflavin-dependent oxidoreductase (nitroreductase family)
MVGPKRVTARARVAEGEERERLWQQMAAIYPPYDKYQQTAGERTIPVVVLDPIASGSAS